MSVKNGVMHILEQRRSISQRSTSEDSDTLLNCRMFRKTKCTSKTKCSISCTLIMSFGIEISRGSKDIQRSTYVKNTSAKKSVPHSKSNA